MPLLTKDKKTGVPVRWLFVPFLASPKRILPAHRVSIIRWAPENNPNKKRVFSRDSRPGGILTSFFCARVPQLPAIATHQYRHPPGRPTGAAAAGEVRGAVLRAGHRRNGPADDGDGGRPGGAHLCGVGAAARTPPPLWGRTALCGVVAVPGSHRHERCSHQWRGPPADSELLLRHCGGGQHHPLLPPHHDGGPGRGAPISARRLSSGKRASATHEGGRGVRLLSPPPYVPWPLRLTACWRWGSRSRAGQWLACNPEGWLLIKCFLICTPQPVLGQPPNGILWVPPPPWKR